MIELGLTLTDYLLKLLQKREDISEKYFELYILPAYEAAESVYTDYLSLLTEIKKKIDRHDNPSDLIRFLEDGRVKFLPIRMRLRAEITSRFEYIDNGRIYYNDMDKLPDFERGILGILIGGLAPFEDKRSISTPYYNSHTLFDVINRFSSYAISGSTDEDNYLDVIKKQIDALNSAWKDVVKGYAEYKKLVVPTPFNKIFGKSLPQKSTKISNKQKRN